MRTLLFDTGALIALERKDIRMSKIWRAAIADSTPITVPSVVIGEWWRGGPSQFGLREAMRAGHAVTLENLTPHLAMLAGEAIAALPGATLVDAVVVASAAQRGDLIYTSDIEHLERLRTHFKGVPRILRV